jgi:anaerobic selenocysteine-containing dehydrogenase
MEMGFQEGDRIWIEEPDGSLRAGIFVGDSENTAWFGGQPGAYVVYADTRSGDQVAFMRIIPREDDEESDATRPG